jgi:hypothetical protein
MLKSRGAERGLSLVSDGEWVIIRGIRGLRPQSLPRSLGKRPGPREERGRAGCSDQHAPSPVGPHLLIRRTAPGVGCTGKRSPSHLSFTRPNLDRASGSFLTGASSAGRKGVEAARGLALKGTHRSSQEPGEDDQQTDAQPADSGSQPVPFGHVTRGIGGG